MDLRRRLVGARATRARPRHESNRNSQPLPKLGGAWRTPRARLLPALLKNVTMEQRKVATMPQGALTTPCQEYASMTLDPEMEDPSQLRKTCGYRKESY